MSDVFIENIVKKKNTPIEILAKIAIVIGILVIIAVIAMFLPALGPFLSIVLLLGVGVIYGGYYLFTSLDIEFESSLTNGEMDLDKIIHQRKRKRLISVKCKNFEEFGRYVPEEHQNRNYQTRIIACDSEQSDTAWYCVVSHPKYGHTLVVFNKTEKMLEGMAPFLPRSLTFKGSKGSE